MALDMWSKNDIGNMLAGIATVARQSAGNQSADWQRGFVAGLTAMCVSFGIAPDSISAHERVADRDQLARAGRL